MSEREKELDDGRKDQLLCAAKNNSGTVASVSAHGCDVTKITKQTKKPRNEQVLESQDKWQRWKILSGGSVFFVQTV